MPVDVVILAPSGANLLAQRELGEAFNPPLIVRESPDGGTVTFSDMDDALVLTLARAKRVDTLRDVTRVLEPATPIPATCGFWTEGYIPFDAITRGLVVAYALAELTNGVTVVKGLPE